MLFRARHYQFQFPGPSLLMGILNVTPDSFSDGGKFFDPNAAVAHGLRMVEEGADILDVGGESTRPFASPVSSQEEIQRVVPVLKALRSRVKIPLSIDTQKPEVARAALEAGADIVNDVAAHRTESSMWSLVAEFKAGYVVMHMQGNPQTMQQKPTYQNVVGEVDDFFGDRLQQLRHSGVDLDHVLLDVGLGFGKTVSHNLLLLAEMQRFTKWQRPLLIGASRKSFLGKVAGGETEDRLPAGVACACWARTQGAQVIRTHDVGPTRQALRMLEAICAQKND